ncbi:MAG TPA: hypothetical protein VMW08_18470 [Acidimicrobiales bacterium]|nr:hypothetical protein [Acidimicrobiales bacterium]
MFVDDHELRRWNAIDGTRTNRELGDWAAFFDRLRDHDLMVVDSSRRDA